LQYQYKEYAYFQLAYPVSDDQFHLTSLLTFY
jgi:hypothetical protein